MVDGTHLSLSRRERQIMEIVYRLSRASVGEVRDQMDDPPSYSAVRATINLLEEKGHLEHQRAGKKYVYAPTVAPAKARKSALRNMLRTFFDNSVEAAVASLLDMNPKDLTDDELDRLEKLIEEAKRKGGGK